MSATETAVLELAGRALQPGAFLTAIRDLGFSTATDYYRHLNQLLDTRRALAAQPVLVARLRRLRQQRVEHRTR